MDMYQSSLDLRACARYAAIVRPWDRQPYDSDESWPIFVAYRDQNPPRRGVLVLVKGRPVNPVQVAGWHEAHFWAQRCAEYDRHLDAIRQAEIEAAHAQTARAVAAKHMLILADAGDIVAREMHKLQRTTAESAGTVLKTNELIKLLSETIKNDRLVRGEATEHVETRDMSKLSDEQLDRMLQEIENANNLH